MLLIQKQLLSFLTKRKYYNYQTRCLAKYKDIDSYLSVFSKRTAENANVKTDLNLSYSSDIGFGSSISLVKRITKSPYTIISTLGVSSVLFYKMKIGTYKVFVEMHFFKEKLFFYKLSFPSSENENSIKEEIRKKYIGTKKEINFERQNIVDASGNYLVVEKEVFMSVYYFSLKYGFYDYVKEFENSVISNIQRRKEKEMLELAARL